MKSLGIIPARGGSKSIPWKNIKKLAGKPLIVYTIEAALASKINRVIVSTESKRIVNIAKEYGVEVKNRPPELAQDDTPTIPVLQNVVKNLDEKFDCVLCLQPTSPFRTSKHIDEALKLYEFDIEAASLVSVVKVPHNMNPNSIMKINERGYLDNFIEQENLLLRRQEKPIFYARNGPAVLIMDINNLQSGELYTGKTIPYVMDIISSIDIDDENDLMIAERIVDLDSAEKSSNIS